MSLKTSTGLIIVILGSLFILMGIVTSCSKTETTQTITKTEIPITVEESANRVAESSTHVAAIGLGQMLDGVTNEDQRVQIVRKFIDPIRFFDDKSGYFYVYYYNCVNLAHAIDKTLPGKDLTDYKDMKGKMVIQELSAMAKKGGGVVEFYWPHPQTKVEQRKIGYVEPIPGTDYFIGTGYYPDTR